MLDMRQSRLQSGSPTEDLEFLQARQALPSSALRGSSVPQTFCYDNAMERARGDCAKWCELTRGLGMRLRSISLRDSNEILCEFCKIKMETLGLQCRDVFLKKCGGLASGWRDGKEGCAVLM